MQGEPRVVRPPYSQRVAHRPLLLGDEFFLIAHDDQTGRPRLHGNAVRYGLAAALLGELAFIGRLTFEHGHVVVRNAWPPEDWLQRFVLSAVAADQRHTATRTWLEYLAETVPDRVAQRLFRQGKVEPVEQRRLLRMFRGGTRHKPTDTNVAAWSWARLSTRLRNYEPLSPFDLALAGITVSCRLDGFVLDGAPNTVGAHLRRLLCEAPEPMRDLFAHLDREIGTAVMSHRD
ncbi:GOLPH3/VPS74 family protein [Micromonospora sp. DT227]